MAGAGICILCRVPMDREDVAVLFRAGEAPDLGASICEPTAHTHRVGVQWDALCRNCWRRLRCWNWHAGNAYYVHRLSRRRKSEPSSGDARSRIEGRQRSRSVCQSDQTWAWACSPCWRDYSLITQSLNAGLRDQNMLCFRRNACAIRQAERAEARMAPSGCGAGKCMVCHNRLWAGVRPTSRPLWLYCCSDLPCRLGVSCFYC